MALEVEDGTGKEDADSYLSLADADLYWDNHGAPSEWTGADDSDKEGALRYGTDFLDGKFTWRGFITTSTQALGWPRGGVFDDEGRLLDSESIPRVVRIRYSRDGKEPYQLFRSCPERATDRLS